MVCMFLKYAVYLTNRINQHYALGFENNMLYHALFNTLNDFLSPICHMIYASQYLKTYFLSSCIVKKALLLFERHRSVIDTKIARESNVSDLLSKNSIIDLEIKKERIRSKSIHKIFLIVDTIFVVLMTCTQGTLYYV